jgi:hypothetical protein
MPKVDFTDVMVRPAKSSGPKPTEPIENLVIAAVDPGWHTGMAFSLKGQLATCVALNETQVLQFLEQANYVIVEEFNTAGRLSNAGHDTIELIGQIKGFCKARGIGFELKLPTSRYAFLKQAQAMCGKDKLILKSSTSRHEVDALAHLLGWLSRYKNGQ